MSAGRDADESQPTEPADVTHMEKDILLKVDDVLCIFFLPVWL